MEVVIRISPIEWLFLGAKPWKNQMIEMGNRTRKGLKKLIRIIQNAILTVI